MRFPSSSGVLALAGVASAFPAGFLEDAKRVSPELFQRGFANDNGDAPVFPGDYIFSEDQLIDVTGAHAFVPPGQGDIRGPCPGLNAFANHNYLPHNGIATIGQFFTACQNVVGMGDLLAGFLSVYGAFFDGDGSGWSIGGAVPGEPGTGISNSHNNYESDASPTRPDLYQEGNAYLTKVDQFQQLIDTQPNSATANYNIQVLTDFRSARFDHQISTNPYFFNGPFSGVLVQPAAYTFIYRFMANHSLTDPIGVLNQDVLKSWFAISGDSGSYSVQQGWERIPANWYRRSMVEPYEVDYFFADVLYAAGKYPKFLDVGGNTGTPNSFVGLDIANLTGGLYNAQTLTQGDNLACFAYQSAQQLEPKALLNPLQPVTSAFAPIYSHFNCSQLQKYDAASVTSLPGYVQSAPSA